MANPIWQLNGFNHILAKSGGDQVLTTSTLIRDHPERGEEREVPQGESDGSQPQDSLPDDGEAGMTFWSISGNYMYRHHVEPRVKLDVSKEISYNHCASRQGHTVHQLSLRPLPEIFRKYLAKLEMKIIRTLRKETVASSTEKPAAEAKPTHLFGMHVAWCG